MDIRIDDDYAIASDKYQFILYKIKVKKSGESKGEEKRDVVGYYPRIDAALEGYVSEQILNSDVTTVQQLLFEIRRLKEFIKEIAY